MKKIVVFLMTVTLMLMLVACGANKETTVTTIAAKDCYGNAGYTEFVAGAEQSAVYTFTAEQSEEVEWSIYVLDDAFDDGYRYIAQAAEPALVGDGTIPVDAGQYVYIYCSANEFTTDAADEKAKLNITVE